MFGNDIRKENEKIGQQVDAMFKIGKFVGWIVGVWPLLLCLFITAILLILGWKALVWAINVSF